MQIDRVVIEEPVGHGITAAADPDFREEVHTDANLFFVDAPTDRVGFGTNATVPPCHRDLRAAYGVLSRLVRDEYPAGLTLAAIAATWGAATERELAALRRLEALDEAGGG